MSKVFHEQLFEYFRDSDSAQTFSDLEFKRCKFVNCVLSSTNDPSLRSIVRGVKILECQQVRSWIFPAVVEDVLVDGLNTGDALIIRGAVFKHVVLKGKIGRVLMTPHNGSAWDPDPVVERAFDEANAAYYTAVDWALDIREGIFHDLDIRSVPAHLIRRDPATQVLVTREKAMQGKWRDLDLSKTHWATALELFLESGAPAKVFVARKGHRKFKSDLEGLMKLRDAGVAEPD